ncbi:MAG: flagellar biosynthetic protein FliR [Oscillospiraceae bacterium]|jgi:flagellar biosynthetic protein FliR|nr:flagellar biosynthetic protein FliR [Oscillospiraceae bacterium]
MSAVTSILENADYFVLMLLRVGGLIFSSPIFGRTNIPRTAKIGLVACLSFLFFLVFPPSAPIEYSTLLGFFLLCAGELLLGIALAFITNMFFALIFVSGGLIDMQIGFGIVNVYDPQNRTQIPMTGNILNLVLLIIFFAVDGQHRLIEIIYLTIQRMPIGGLHLAPDIGIVALDVFARSFTLGVMVSLPVVASGLVLEFAFGLLVRTVPQMNVFVVGIPIKLFVGMIVLLFMLPVFVNFSNEIFSQMFIAIEDMFSAFA